MNEATPKQPTSVPFENNPFKIMVNGLTKQFDTNTRSAVILIVAYIAMNILSYVLGLAVGSQTTEQVARFQILNLAFAGIGIFIGLMSMILSLKSQKGESMEINELFHQSLSKFLPYLGYSIVLGFIYVFAFLAGLLTLFIPFVLAIVWLGYTLYVKLDEDLPLGKSMEQSKNLVKGRGLEFLAVTMLGGLVGVFGGPALQSAVLAEEYMQLKVLRAANLAEQPPVSKLCWLLVIVPILLAIAFIGIAVALLAISGQRFETR